MTTLSINQEKYEENEKRSEMDFTILHKCFHENHMVLNPGKCHYIVICNDDPFHKIILNNNEIASSNGEKLLDILLNSKLNFDSHVTFLFKKANQKLSALLRINHYLTPDQKILLAIKLSSKILVQLLPTDLDVYFSIYKQCIKQYSRKTLHLERVLLGGELR